MPKRNAGPSRQKPEGETGQVIKDWGGKISLALIYPNHYRIGMSSLGFQVVYGLLNRKQQVVAERVFFPDPNGSSLPQEAGRGLRSLESSSPLLRFDILAFSLSFENDFPNILKILELSRIPFLAEQRDESLPLVMAGGIITFLNPEPLAPFFDLFLLGEAEAVLDSFVDCLFDLKHQKISKNEKLKELVRNVPGLYVPSFYESRYHSDGILAGMDSIEKGIPDKISVSRHAFGADEVTCAEFFAPDTELGDRILVELGRGCSRSCRFCAAGYVYRPPRMQSEAALLHCIAQKITENHSFGLLSASVLDTPGIQKIMAAIIAKQGQFSISSVRADALTAEIAMCLEQAGQKRLALAPEAGSERLRRVINKHLSQEQILEAARLIAEAGTFSPRLYFLMGLPTENQEDMEAILDLVKRFKHQMIRESRARGRIGTIHLSVNCFIPKPFTPFQWFPMENVETLKTRQKWLKKAFEKEGGVSISFDVPRWAYVQALLARGDRRTAKMLLLAHQNQGQWKQAFKQSEINPDFFVYRSKELDEVLPWDFIDHGIRKEYLQKEYRLALQGEESEICRPGECVRCGVCG
jgi:radical SAM family uncharacterized protein